MTSAVEALVAAGSDTPGPVRGPGDRQESVRLWGALTAATAVEIRERIRRCARRKPARLLIDLESVRAIDAAGVATLLDAQRAMGIGDAGLVVLRVNATVRRALKESGTIEAFTFWNGREACST